MDARLSALLQAVVAVVVLPLVIAWLFSLLGVASIALRATLRRLAARRGIPPTPHGH